MKFLKALKNFIVGAPEIATDVFDKDNGLLVRAGKFIGGLNYSEQEQAEVNLKLADQVIEHVKATKDENTIKSKARRELAIMWIKTQLHLIWINVILVPLAILSPEQGKPMFDMMLKITLSWLMVGGTVTVMAYFFGTYGWGTYVKGGKR